MSWIKLICTTAIISTLALVVPAAAMSDDDSIYQLDHTWTTQNQKKIRLAELSGKHVVLSMVYTTCEHTCPTIVSNMQTIEKSLPKQQSKDVVFVLVSLQPDVDTPLIMKAYQNKRNLDQWLLLSGDSDNVRTLSMILDVRYQATNDGEIAHSNLITILDPQGRIEHQLSGTSINKDEALTHLQ